MNGTECTSDGKSPRCTLFQVNEGIRGIWKHDCTRLQKNQTVKGVLQAWKEKHKRDIGSTWWGLEREEVKPYVVGCLSQTTGEIAYGAYQGHMLARDPGFCYASGPTQHALSGWSEKTAWMSRVGKDLVKITTRINIPPMPSKPYGRGDKGNG